MRRRYAAVADQPLRRAAEAVSGSKMDQVCRSGSHSSSQIR
jgi:hypothetical protein